MNNDVCDTDIRAELLSRWATAARDPGTGVCDWLTQGAHAGMCADPEGVDGIFPRADEENQEDFETEEYIPIRDADDVDLDSLEQIEGYEKKGWMERTTREKLIREFGPSSRCHVFA